MEKTLKITQRGTLCVSTCFRKEETMKTNIGGGTFHLAKYVLFSLFILVLSCTSTSFMRLEGNDFEKNLPGLWEGKWSAKGFSGKQHIKILKIEGNKVHLTGFTQGFGSVPDADEVYGSIENSALLLTWPAAGCKEKYTMKRDDYDNLILDGSSICEAVYSAKVQLKKIE
jgi:hypothetical protein